MEPLLGPFLKTCWETVWVTMFDKLFGDRFVGKLVEGAVFVFFWGGEAGDEPCKEPAGAGIMTSWGPPD